MRLGATILGAANDHHALGLDSLVLWDPCDSGRSYLRQLSALEALRREHHDADTNGSIEIAEYVFSAAAADDVRRLSLVTPGPSPLASRVLVLTREDRSVSDKLRSRLEPEHVEFETTTEQGALLDVDPLSAKLPERAIARIVSWIGSSGATPAPFEVPEGATSAMVAREGGREPVQERLVQLGPGALFGIVAEPVEHAHGPWLVLLNVATDEHTGPSRLWVELSRRWAGFGLRCVRFDLSGLGDSPWSPGEPDRPMYDHAWLEDMVDVARTLSPDDPSDTVFIGLCSGAYLAVEAGRSLRARGVCAINPPVGVDFLAGTARLASSRHAPVRSLAATLKEVALRLRWFAVLLWHVGRVVLPPVFNVDVLAEVVNNGTDLYVLASTEDLSPAPTRRGLDRIFSRRLVAPKNYEVHFVPGLDHSMLAATGRARAVEQLDRHVLACFAGITSDGAATHNLDDKEHPWTPS
jgi:hypothetical protein